LFLAIFSSLTNTLYQVQYADFNCESAYISSSTFSMCLWHHRMGYLSLHIINSIVCQKTIHGLDVFTPKEFDHLYNRYTNEKSHHILLVICHDHSSRKHIPIVHSLLTANPIKPIFHGSYLTCNMLHNGDAIIWIFCLP